MQIPLDPTAVSWPLACVEVGGGSIQTVLFEGDRASVLEGPVQPDGFELAIAVPGVISDGLVHATNLGWRGTDPAEALGLQGPARVMLNDAEAASLGEAVLRGDSGLDRLVYLCAGTGIGGAVVAHGQVLRANLFGHNVVGYGVAFGTLPCPCERIGCLETVAAGWALPGSLTERDVRNLGDDLASAIERNELSAQGTVVIGGGIAYRYPALVTRVAARLPGRNVEPSMAPREAKSAAAWGLRYALTGAVEVVR